MNKSIFKAYDIRGVVPDELSEHDVYLIAKGFATFLLKETGKEKLRIALGQDNRLSSPVLHAAAMKGLTESGIDVVDIGLAPTPVFYFAVTHLGLDGGINITASHNPPHYNGLKMVRAAAAPIGAESGLHDIYSLCEEGQFISSDAPGSISKEDVLSAYAKTALTLAPLGDVSHLKVVVDTGNGVASVLCEEYFKKVPIQLFPLFFELDGTFPNHMPDPLKLENVTSLIEEVKKQNADLGIALDADADRVFFIDEKGNHLPSDLITALVAEYVLKKEPGAKIIYDVRSSRVVKETIEKNGGVPLISRVGHTFIKELMRKEQAFFGGELSGHFYSRDMGYVDAPLLAVNAVLSLLATSGKKMSELLAPLHTYAKTPEINFTVSDKETIMRLVEERYRDATISRLDGITIEYPDWWVNIRPSNTESLLRLNLEAANEDLLHEKLWEITGIIRAYEDRRI
ncbi:MAG: phosphomannomutase/phosphoglucomutase [bacterium]|nr:phosphomannomutase/phosphoglucomutase [bacterium]